MTTEELNRVYTFLCDQAKLFGVEVQVEYRFSGYNPTLKIIRLDEDLSFNARIVVFSHELGHHIDLTCLSEHERRASNAAVNLFWLYRDKSVGPAIMKCERSAWKYGRMLLALAGFSDWDLFEEIRKRTLQTYVEATK